SRTDWSPGLPHPCAPPARGWAPPPARSQRGLRPPPATAGGSCTPALASCNPLDFHRKTRGFGAGGHAGRMILWRQRWFGAGLEGHGGGMDLLEAKSRIAEALVESIFRRARYDVAPFRLVDLIELKEFGLFAHTLEDHEALARRIFNSLTA